MKRSNSVKNIADDGEDISNMVLNSKLGNWEVVWEILDRKGYLINCVPSERAWGALHQAAYLGNAEAVRKLLSYPACDPRIRTKQDRKNEHGPGKTPIELTKDPIIIKIFKEDMRATNELITDYPPTFVAIENIREPIGGCIQLALCCCKGTLIPPDMELKEIERASIFKLMKYIFDFIDHHDNWLSVKKRVSLKLQQYSISLGIHLWSGNEKVGITSETLFDTKDQFYGRAIKLYVESKRQLFRNMNLTLRAQGEYHDPSGIELSVAPIAILLNAILLNWENLRKFFGFTYRWCKLESHEVEQYTPGRLFMWISFSSSSRSQSGYCGSYLFVINNGGSKKWAPVDISSYSGFNEEECLYAFGAIFQVGQYKERQ